MHEANSPLVYMILFLALCDLTSCSTLLVNYFLKHGGPSFGFRHAVSTTTCLSWIIPYYCCGTWAWITLGAIALIRCMSVASKQARKIFSSKKINLIIIPTIIVFGLIAISPHFLDVSIDGIHEIAENVDLYHNTSVTLIEL